jgi:hypothetical protein
MDEIIRFVMLAQSARFTVSERCEQFGISRKTGYKHLDRYAADGNEHGANQGVFDTHFSNLPVSLPIEGFDQLVGFRSGHAVRDQELAD